LVINTESSMINILYKDVFIKFRFNEMGMKYCFVVIAFFLLSCKQQRNGFVLKGNIDGEYSGYLYIDYNKKVDSALIINKKFSFTGKVKYPTFATFHTSGTSSSPREFYLENENILANISIEKKIFGETKVDWIIIDTVLGTSTSIIRYDFDLFKNKYKKTSDWKSKLYKKVNKILEENPNNNYSAFLLLETLRDTILSNKELRTLYSKINKKSQVSSIIKTLEYDIFPERRLVVGKTIPDFKLVNTEGDTIGTIDYRGKLLFIDFWATWCLPCRNEFPELIIIGEQFRSDNFIILGVSLDDNTDNWIKTIKKDNLLWENVIDTTSLDGEIAKNYGIFEIPRNVLVNEKGVVIAMNLRPSELKAMLKEIVY